MTKELILMGDVPGLGIEGDVVKVAEGYARNFLLPKKLAVPVTSMSRRQMEARHAVREDRLRSERERAELLASKLEDASVTLPAKAGEDGKLYGSVHDADIATALEGQGIKVDRHCIKLKTPLRELGVHDVVVSPHPELQATIKVCVVEE